MSNYSDPVKVLKSWLDAIMNRDYVKAWKFCQLTWKADHTKANLKLIFDYVPIQKYQILEVETITEAHVKITIKAKQIDKVKKAAIHLICEIMPYKPTPKGRWGVNPISAIKDMTLAELQGNRTTV